MFSNSNVVNEWVESLTSPFCSSGMSVRPLDVRYAQALYDELATIWVAFGEDKVRAWFREVPEDKLILNEPGSDNYPPLWRLVMEHQILTYEDYAVLQPVPFADVKNITPEEVAEDYAYLDFMHNLRMLTTQIRAWSETC